MVTYKCFKCGKKVNEKELEKRFVCPECGGRIFYKIRNKTRKLKTD